MILCSLTLSDVSDFMTASFVEWQILRERLHTTKTDTIIFSNLVQFNEISQETITCDMMGVTISPLGETLSWW